MARGIGTGRLTDKAIKAFAVKAAEDDGGLFVGQSGPLHRLSNMSGLRS